MKPLFDALDAIPNDIFFSACALLLLLVVLTEQAMHPILPRQPRTTPRARKT